WLRKNNYLKLRWSPEKTFLFYRFYLLLRKYLPKKIYNKFFSVFMKRNPTKTKVQSKEIDVHPESLTKMDKTWQKIRGVDWKKTQASMDQIWAIRLRSDMNDKEKEMVKNDIIRKLRALRHKGKPVIDDAWKREEVFSGKCLDELPEIIFLPNHDYEPNGVIVGKIFSRRFRKKKYKDGEHYPSAISGILMALGSYFKSGTEIDGAKLLDMAPTILHFFGIPKPDDMDGNVIKEIFNDDFKFRKRKIRKTPSTKRIDKTKMEKEQIKETLKHIKL
ncbi:MAG: hypothetical protein KAW40_01940, partial [Candidatus Aenigmarchaeota archaeon]|nr:hypothetical protein [Candidatus Aenigmarchaeota archaeon]